MLTRIEEDDGVSERDNNDDFNDLSIHAVTMLDRSCLTSAFESECSRSAPPSLRKEFFLKGDGIYIYIHTHTLRDIYSMFPPPEGELIGENQ